MSWYSIYKNINENEFADLKNRFDQIERIVSPRMQMNGFYLDRTSFDEIVGLDYISSNNDFYGNIGVLFDDDKSYDVKKFNVYVLKSYDKNGTRYYKRIDLSSGLTINEIEENCIKLFDECVSFFFSIKKEDLNESILLKRNG